MILSQKVTEKQFSIKIMLYWSHPARFNYVFELTRNFICTNILATEAKSPSKKTKFGWCDYLNRSGVQNINVSVCQRWMTEKTTELKPTNFSERKMLKHVAFWAFVFLPFSTGICPISSWIHFFKSNTVSGLYFHIGETERKCFIEEIPDETMVTGNYKVLLSTLKNHPKIASALTVCATGPALWPKDKWIRTVKVRKANIG